PRTPLFPYTTLFRSQFASKTVGQRAMQLFAGPMMNFVLAIVIFIILGLVQGVPSDRIIGEVQPNSPAEEAGIIPGDQIIQVEGNSISTWQEFTSIIQENAGKGIDIVVKRDDHTESLTVTPKEITIEDVKIGQVGVTLALEKSFFKTFKYGFQQTYERTTLILE